MEQYLHQIQKSAIFEGLDKSSVLHSLGCLRGVIRHYKKDSTIFFQNQRVEFLAIVLEGEVKIQTTDYEGNCNIISKVYPCDTLAAASVFSFSKTVHFDCVCACDVTLLAIEPMLLTSPCKNACPPHKKIIENCLMTIADKSTLLAKKIQVLTKRTLREKVLAYLHPFSQGKGVWFSIPLSRKQMAEFLSVDRSALSRVLGELQNQKIIQFSGNRFIFI